MGSRGKSRSLAVAPLYSCSVAWHVNCRCLPSSLQSMRSATVALLTAAQSSLHDFRSRSCQRSMERWQERLRKSCSELWAAVSRATVALRIDCSELGKHRQLTCHATLQLYNGATARERLFPRLYSLLTKTATSLLSSSQPEYCRLTQRRFLLSAET